MTLGSWFRHSDSLLSLLTPHGAHQPVFTTSGDFFEITTRESAHMMTNDELKKDLKKIGEKAIQIGDPLTVSIIKRLGGVQEIAANIELSKVRAETIHGWIHSGIPPNYTTREALRRLARKKFDVVYEGEKDFLIQLLKDIDNAEAVSDHISKSMIYHGNMRRNK